MAAVMTKVRGCKCDGRPAGIVELARASMAPYIMRWRGDGRHWKRNPNAPLHVQERNPPNNIP